MFDKLIESKSDDAGFKPRGRYFTASTIVVGILFVTAVVASLYAQRLDIGTYSLDAAELLAPVAPEMPEPNEPIRNTQRDITKQTSDTPLRRVEMLRIDEFSATPDKISVVPNEYRSRPSDRFNLSTVDLDRSGPPSGSAGPAFGTGSVSQTLPTDDDTAAPSTAVAPPPPKAAPIIKKPVSIGVANGQATYLPKPLYSRAARLVGADGDVTVQITIDEQGKVVSAQAVGGHPMLRAEAEKAARLARFTPTLLSKVPVKVTGVIVYKFTK